MAQSSDNSIKVLVRVRPLLAREKRDSPDQKCLISMPESDPTITILKVPTSSAFSSTKTNIPNRSNNAEAEDVKKYNFDESVWSFDEKDPHYVNNHQFYKTTGPSILNHFFQGFNVCLLAYGQTSSGKTFTMMGDRKEPGLIPLIVRDILRQKEVLVGERINCEVKLSYIEIYNEQVKDLLGSSAQGKCRVREHPVTGPYVENLNNYTINDYADFTKFLDQGNEQRSTASTSMNERSSRSHAIITLSLKQTKFKSADDTTDIGDAEEEMISSIKLVDLAGSERLLKTKVYGQQDRMKEGTSINKSLTVLGRCINQLANNEINGGKATIVPYRDSILTYLLKENLGGNSKSFMIFCVSPIDFEETYQTLNYANQVKTIKTTAKANKTKLSTVPIDWKQMETNDHDAILSLKNEISELTNKLASLSVQTTNTEEDDRFTKIINFLEKESSKVKFENKFLRKQLLQKSSQVTELTNHVSYMEHEIDSLHQELSRHQFRSFETARDQLFKGCEANDKEIELDLLSFDPAKVL